MRDAYFYGQKLSMARILTGIQSTGTPHLGNILGAIAPAIEMAEDPKNDSFLFPRVLSIFTFRSKIYRRLEKKR